MQNNDTQLGRPQVLFKDTKANIEAITGLSEAAIAYAFDANEVGTYDGSSWTWVQSGNDVRFYTNWLGIVRDVYQSPPPVYVIGVGERVWIHDAGGGLSGDFVGHNDEIAYRTGTSTWIYHAPVSGDAFFLDSNNVPYIYLSGIWGTLKADPYAHATRHVTGGTDVIANAVPGGNAGLMSGADKTKLDGIANGALSTHDHSGAGAGGTTLQVDKDIYRFGFIASYDGTQETTISYDGANIFTLAPTGSSWSYYRDGIKHTISGSKTVTLSGSPPATKGLYFIYIDSTSGTLVADTSGWNLEDTKVPVATIEWDNAMTPKYWLSDERHTVAIDRRFHFEHHFSDGTEVATFPVLSGYSVAPAVPTDANNTFAVAQSVVIDEDLKHVISALPDGDGTSPNYITDYRTAADAWVWVKSIMPYRYTVGGYIQWDNAGTMTEGSGNKFYVTYLLLANRQGDGAITQIHGQAEYATLAAAQASTFASLAKTKINIAEFVACWQIVWETSAAYTTKGKCRMAAEPRSISVSASGAGGAGAVDHESLTGLQGGGVGDHSHLTAVQATGLTGGGATTLHSHAASKLDDLAAPDDNTDLNASTATHGLMLKAVAPAAGSRNIPAIDNAETVFKMAALFDATNPANLGVASPGTQLAAARRDHVHAMPTAADVGAIPTTGGTVNGGLALDGFFTFNRGSATISGDAITATASFMAIDTEGGAAADNLATINGQSAGRLLILQSTSNSRDITVKTTGNIKLPVDRVLNNIYDKLFLIADNTNWYELVFSDNGT